MSGKAVVNYELRQARWDQGQRTKLRYMDDIGIFAMKTKTISVVEFRRKKNRSKE